MNPKSTYAQAVMLVILVIVFPVNIIGHFLWNDYKLMNEGRTTTGVVTSFDPNNHSALHYSYSVNGTSYTGSRAGEFHPTGSPLLIYYLPENPQISIFNLPQNNFYNDAIPFGMFLLAIFVVIIFMIHKARKNSQL